MFSFLTGKKDEASSTRTSSAAGAGTTANAVAAAEAEGMPLPGPPADPSPAPASSAAPQTPFTPPDAWVAESGPAAKADVPPALPDVGPLDPDQTAALQGKIIEAIKTVFDPEIPVDIYELGLIYDIIVDAERRVLVNMTLTSPACPSAQQIPGEVRFKVKSLPEVTDARVEIVWEPAWTKERMSEAAKLTLGFF